MNDLFGPQFNSSRLTLARKRRGLKKKELAELVGVETRSITAYEAGEYAPDDSRLDRMVQLLGFPRDFFFEDDLDEVPYEAVAFRSVKRMTAAQRDRALAAGAFALLLSRWLEKKYILPEPDVPNLADERTPEEAAEVLRGLWDLGQIPVKNMIHLLESRGVRVFSLAVDSLDLDAYSMWVEATPFVFLNLRKSSERSRFDAAHELGHLVLHTESVARGPKAEKEADRFASAFLMPRDSIIGLCSRITTLQQVIVAKQNWKVSVMALVRRLYDLGLLTEWQHRSFCVKAAKLGYRTSEPKSCEREVSKLLRTVFSLLREDGISRSALCAKLRLPEDEIDQLTFGLAFTVLSGTTDVETPISHTRPRLTVINGGKSR